jgi:hypothetical protein
MSQTAFHKKAEQKANKKVSVIKTGAAYVKILLYPMILLVL